MSEITKEVKEQMKHDKEVFDKTIKFQSPGPIALCPQCGEPNLLRHNVDSYYCKSCNQYYRVKVSQKIQDLNVPETQSNNA